MAGLPIILGGGELVLNGLSMNTHGWSCYDYTQLLLGFASLRNAEDPVIPPLDGRVGFDDELDETTYSLPMWLTGEADEDGTAYSNELVGLRRNRDALRSGVPQGQLVAAVFHFHDTDALTITDTAKAAFEFVGDTAVTVPMMLHLTVPGGYFGDELTPDS